MYFYKKEYRKDKPKLMKITIYNVWMGLNRRKMDGNKFSQSYLYIGFLFLDHANIIYIQNKV